ncbi:hypothetical protein [Kribbella sp. CA-293567]|uniref:hypothetical protein n=1 Tax=Kribbella sp. CA-293567 TaxID=3002436 RepID=UPI0022DD056A|nr:hypothetical protein [Kribbella sp. CA-293567]WBQ07919.1 hypothetical protein OX958_14215 [Kribbella sp. CA-293567]
MRIRRFALAVAGLSLVTGAVAANQATAEVQGKPQPSRQQLAVERPNTKAQAVAGACRVFAGAVTAAGQNGGYLITATKPVTASPYPAYKLFGVRASSTWFAWSGSGTTKYYSGLVLVSGSLYATAELYKTPESEVPVVSSKRLGTGWSSFLSLASSRYVNAENVAESMFLYGLNTNGTLYRYSINGPTGPVSAAGSAPGYKSFKSITTIAETPTYDTLLGVTKTGGIYTIHLPKTRLLKGTLKLVRTTGFAAYHQLVAERCGDNGGTLLTGFNNAANTATVYALSKAKGAQTLVNTIGSVALPQDATVHMRYITNTNLIGE